MILIPGWEDGLRVDAMRSVLVAKFADDDLRALLLATGDALLFEGNVHHDNFWGSCSCRKLGCRLIPGTNQLGLLLMQLRAGLRH